VLLGVYYVLLTGISVIRCYLCH